MIDNDSFSVGRYSYPVGLSGSPNYLTWNGLAYQTPGPLGVRASLLNNPNLLAQNGNAQAPSTSIQAPLITEPDQSKSVNITHTLEDMKVNGVSLQLFGKSGAPEPQEVVQGNLPNCPVASILLAKTLRNPQAVKNMITPLPVIFMPTKPKSNPSPIQANAAFAIAFPRPIGPSGNNVTIVSSLLYVDSPHFNSNVKYTGPKEIIYMRSNPSGDPALGIFWSSFIEKGYAVLMGGYDKLDHPSVGEVMFDFCGLYDMLKFEVSGQANFSVFSANLFEGNNRLGNSSRSKSIKVNELDANLIELFKRANQLPTIVCTGNSVSNGAKFFPDHCYAVASFSGTNIVLRNPLVRLTSNNSNTLPQYTVSLAELKSNFSFVFQAKTN